VDKVFTRSLPKFRPKTELLPIPPRFPKNLVKPPKTLNSP
jgi:hypothetical protein